MHFILILYMKRNRENFREIKSYTFGKSGKNPEKPESKPILEI